MMAVSIEIGSSAAVMERARVSTMIRKVPPNEMHAGIRCRWSLPNTMRHICGTISPTQPTWPHMEIDEAVAMVAHKIAIMRSRGIFTPEEQDSSSDNKRRFNLHLKRKSTVRLSAIGITPISRDE